MAKTKLFTFIAHGTVSNGNIKCKFDGEITGPEGTVMNDEERVFRAYVTVKKSHPDFEPTKIIVRYRSKSDSGHTSRTRFTVNFGEDDIRQYSAAFAKLTTAAPAAKA